MVSPQWPLVGRDEELRLLRAALDEGRSAVIAGPAGVGKSRLLSESLERIESTGWKTVLVRGSPAMSSIPYGPFARWVPANAHGSPSRVHLLQAAEAALVEGESPVVVGVDDAHALDDESVALLLHLATRPSARLVIAVRSGVPCPAGITALWKDDLAERIEVYPLSDTEVTSLVERVLDGPLAQESASRLALLTGGLPLHLREVVEATRGAGALTRRTDGSWRWDGELPGTERLNDLLNLRLATAPSAVKGVLEVVALAEPLDLDLAACLDATAVDEAERTGLVVVDRAAAGGGSLRPAHPLYGEVLRSSLPAMTTRGHFRTLADAALSSGWHEANPLRTAMWLLEAGSRHDHATVLQAAAADALSRRDGTLAVRLSRAAIAAGAGAHAGLTLASALIQLEEWDEVDTVLSELVATSQPEVVVHAARLHSLALYWGRADPARGLRVVEDAARTVDGPARGWLLGQQAATAIMSADPGRAVAAAQEALALAGPMLGVRVSALGQAALAWTLQGETAAAIVAWETVLPYVYAALPEDPTAGLLGPSYAVTLVLAGRLEEAARFAEDLLERVRAHHVPAYAATPLNVAALVALTQGRLDKAARYADEALGTYKQHNAYGGGDWCAAIRAAAAAQAGDLPSAEAALAWADGHDCPSQLYRLELAGARAWVMAAKGETSAGARQAIEAAVGARRHGLASVELASLMIAARLGAAGDVAGRLRELAAEVDGDLYDAVAQWATALSKRDGEGLDVAAERLASTGVLLVAAEAFATAAKQHGLAGRTGSRLSSLARARALAAACAGPKTPGLSGLNEGSAALDDLSAREREVAGLAARGLSNREIAERLFVSVRTVHSHLQSAYTKLGTNDRAHLAVLLGTGDSSPA